MITTIGPQATALHEEFLVDQTLPKGQSGVIARLLGSATSVKMIQKGGRRKIEYPPNSFWRLPPVDLGKVRSDRLDDFLYGPKK